MTADKASALVPRLRFPEFRDALHWDIRSLREMVNVIAGQSPSGENYNTAGNGVPFYQGKTDFGDMYLKKPTKWTTQVTKLAQPSDILMSVRAPVGALNVTTEQICIGRGLASLQPRCYKWFLYYALLGQQGRIIGNGGSVFDSINKKQIEDLPILAPQAAAEQQKIADCLCSLDDLIAAEGRKLEALRQHKQGLMQQLFPQPGETVPRLRFPEFMGAPDWKEATLGTLLEQPPDYGVNAAAVPLSESLPTYIRITDINDDGQFEFRTRVSVNIDATDKQYLDNGDIVLARTGASVGKSYRYREEDGRLVHAGFLIRVSPNPDRLHSQYLAGYFMTWRYWDWVRLTSARSGQPGINAAEYASIPLPLPPDGHNLAEQQKIADCLGSLDDLIAAKGQKLEALRKHKQGLMQQLFPSLEKT